MLTSLRVVIILLKRTSQCEKNFYAGIGALVAKIVAGTCRDLNSGTSTGLSVRETALAA